MRGSKLIIASARLPVALSREQGAWRARPSPGGLATALRAVAADRPFTWIGWPGVPVDPADQEPIRRVLAAKGDRTRAVPVFLDEAEVVGFYEEISNRVLWPLFHNLGGAPVDKRVWRDYVAVNERFADAIAEQAEPDDVVWVHDYQLMLVPNLLRDRGVDSGIGFFLHIPFPSPDAYRTLPVREEILRGMLGADLVGFHTYEYVSHFRNACLRVLGLESEPESIPLPSHDAHLGVHPIGIEPDEIAAMARDPEVEAHYQELRRLYADKTVILGVDRLDYTKGLPQKLQAFEELLESDPSLRDRVVLVQVAAPSRTGVTEYQHLKREMDELAGRINGRFGNLKTQPLVYINQSVPRARLTALYRLADIGLVTPVRDGMNLVALEYVAARSEPGTLILSEFAGAASCLPGARLVNPHDPSGMARVLAAALAEGPSAQAWADMRDFVASNTATRWASRFLGSLEGLHTEERQRIHPLRIAETPELVAGVERPLFLLDYDGTLVGYARVPEEARPGARVRDILRELAEWGTIYVVSGRPADFLDSCFGDLPIGLVCEHGLAIKSRSGEWSERPAIDAAGIHRTVEPVFADYTERTPGSRIEHKASSIAWHYRGADPKLGAFRAKELREVLEQNLRGLPYSVLSGSRVIEVRHAQMTKAAAATALLRRHSGADFVFCAGDDRTDEEMFDAVLRDHERRSIVCKVGGVNTLAPYTVRGPSDLLEQLEQIVGLWRRAAAE